MAMQPVLTSISAPRIRGGTVQVLGEAFGRVSSVALIEQDTFALTETDFQIDTGNSIHFTLPVGQPDGTYYVLLGTLDGQVSTNNAGSFVLPDDSPQPPAPGDHTLENPIPDYTSPAMDAIRARTRLELGDFDEPFSASVQGDGLGRRFDLPEDVIDASTLLVAVADANADTSTTLTLDTDYTIDAKAGIITLPAPLPTGQTLQILGRAFQFFTDDEIDGYILSAALKHTRHQSDETAYRPVTGYKRYLVTQQTIDTLPPVEYHVVALKAAIEALWIIATDASFDISVSTAEGTSLPREERFTNVLQLIQLKQEQYDDLCRNLNVGLNRIEVFQLRRVSRTTNRYVPIYRHKEYDDYSLPDRIYVNRPAGKTGADTEAPDPYFGGGGVYP